jgi:ADP-dependent NAD(P)H-hydrate dehydratase / NAD(P)H-hydrate epimerase
MPQAGAAQNVVMTATPFKPGTATDSLTVSANPADQTPGPVPVGASNAPPGGWPLHDREAARAAEASALAQAAPFRLMALAGAAVARLARALAPHAQRVQVLAGPGNNGGDGLVAARLLQAAGLQVQVIFAGEPTRLPADAARAWREARDAGLQLLPLDGPQVPYASWGSDSSGCEPPGLLIDALLGLGSRSAPSGAVAAAIAHGRALANRGVPVLAVDLPSGMHPDTGQPLGHPDQVLTANATLCLLTLRPGCFTGQGRDLAGHVWFDHLHCGRQLASATAWLSHPTAASPRRHASHKGSHGNLTVVGGAAGMVGAALLAARAALAAGAGRVVLSLLTEEAAGVDTRRPELMWRPRLWQSPPPWLAGQTVVAGCGGGSEIGSALPPLLAHAGRLVLDADALNAIAADTALQAQLQRRGSRGLPTLLTPHPLEAARLLQQTTAAVQADRLAAARALAQHFGALVLLKGSGSVLASPGGRTSINPSGNAALATAGTGDVLAGWVGGRWAESAEALESTQDDKLLGLHSLVAGAMWQHGDAADRYLASGRRGPMLAADLVDVLRAGV